MSSFSELVYTKTSHFIDDAECVKRLKKKNHSLRMQVWMGTSKFTLMNNFLWQMSSVVSKEARHFQKTKCCNLYLNIYLHFNVHSGVWCTREKEKVKSTNLIYHCPKTTKTVFLTKKPVWKYMWLLFYGYLCHLYCRFFDWSNELKRWHRKLCNEHLDSAFPKQPATESWWNWRTPSQSSCLALLWSLSWLRLNWHLWNHVVVDME